jgi:TetR/AcrR family transcriptional regulator, cholesterol catabolism regulator
VAEPPMGRRERRRREVEQRLYECALELFTERGYDATTIDDIAEQADVARGTFFNYFQRKEDLISMWGVKRREQLHSYIDTMRTTAPNGVVADLEYCMNALGRMSEEEWPRTRTMLLAWVKAGRPMLEEPHAARIFSQLIQAGRARGEVAPEIDPDRTGNLLRDAYFGILFRWTQHEEPPGSLSEELCSVLHMILGGVLPRDA